MGETLETQKPPDSFIRVQDEEILRLRQEDIQKILRLWTYKNELLVFDTPLGLLGVNPLSKDKENNIVPILLGTVEIQETNFEAVPLAMISSRKVIESNFYRIPDGTQLTPFSDDANTISEEEMTLAPFSDNYYFGIQTPIGNIALARSALRGRISLSDILIPISIRIKNEKKKIEPKVTISEIDIEAMIDLQLFPNTKNKNIERIQELYNAYQEENKAFGFDPSIFEPPTQSLKYYKSFISGNETPTTVRKIIYDQQKRIHILYSIIQAVNKEKSIENLVDLYIEKKELQNVDRIERAGIKGLLIFFLAKYTNTIPQ